MEEKYTLDSKNTLLTGNWFLSLVSCVGVYWLDTMNENGQRKLDLRPHTNNRIDSDLLHLITLSVTSHPQYVCIPNTAFSILHASLQRSKVRFFFVCLFFFNAETYYQNPSVWRER